jgi:guanylate kinase
MSSNVKEQEVQPVPVEVKTSGTLFVVSSPSGGGKGTLIRRVLEVVPDLSYSVSYTTRAPRPTEVNGREYFFVDRNTFENMRAAGQFLEWANVHGNLYGTATSQIALETAAGGDIVLEVDVQGAASVRRLALDSVSIFIVPPSYEILKARLVARGTDSAEELEVRLRNAPDELQQFTEFTYVIINDDIERAAGQIRSIIYAERARCERQKQFVTEVIKRFGVSENTSAKINEGAAE